MKNKYIGIFMLSMICLFILTACWTNDSLSENNMNSVSNILQDDVCEMHILADVGDVILKQGEDYFLETDNLINDWLSIENTNGVLKLTYQPPDPEEVKKIDTSEHKIVITLPKVNQVKYAKFVMGTGMLDISDFMPDTLELSQGAGSIALNNITTKSFIIECGIGKIEGQNVVATEKTELSAGMGDVDLAGDLAGEIVIEGGIGSLKLDLKQKRNNYSISGESVMKQIFLDGQAWNNKNEDEVTAKNSINIDGGIGKVEINFGVE